MFYQEIVTSKCPLQCILDMGKEAENYLFSLTPAAITYLKKEMKLVKSCQEIGEMGSSLTFVSKNKQELESFVFLLSQSVIGKNSWLVVHYEENHQVVISVPFEPQGHIVISYRTK